MKKLLIIYPHWPPSNLAGIHRPRLIANFIREFGWDPIVLTVDASFYEEKPDPDILKTVSSKIQVIFVTALKPLKRFRFFGDIGIRAFYQLYKEARNIIEKDKIDFVWIPIPSFYTAVLGRILNTKTGIPYGIDYIDPWVNGFTNHEKMFSKAWISNALAKILEPYSVKNASLISGVSSSYFKAVIDRNFSNKKVEQLGMPYGFDPKDHEIELDGLSYPWGKIPDVKPLVYAGAFLPKSHLFVALLFKSISNLKKQGKWDDTIHLYFIGTGRYPGKTIAEYAETYGISDTVHEITERFPFLHILNFLSSATGVMVIGSTEAHYTASKIFQSLLSRNPVFSIFHNESSAVQILKEANADTFLCVYNESISASELEKNITETFLSFIQGEKKWFPKTEALTPYSARQSAFALSEKLNLIVSKK